MIQVLTPRQWFEENVDITKLREDIINSLTDSVRNEVHNDEFYYSNVHDIIDGKNGTHIPFYALEYFGYELNTNDVEQYDLEKVMQELDDFTGELEEIIESYIHESIKVSFGEWESDGTYCFMAFMNKSEFDENRVEHRFMDIG